MATTTTATAMADEDEDVDSMATTTTMMMADDDGEAVATATTMVMADVGEDDAMATTRTTSWRWLRRMLATRWQRRRDEIEESETRPTEIYPPRFRSMTHVDGFWPDENSWTLLRWNALFKANARHWPPMGRNMENPLTGRSDCLLRMNPEKKFWMASGHLISRTNWRQSCNDPRGTRLVLVTC